MCAYTVFTVGLRSLDLPKPISNTVTTVNMMLSLVSGLPNGVEKVCIIYYHRLKLQVYPAGYNIMYT